MTGDQRLIQEVQALRRDVRATQQPVVVVPFLPGESYDSVERRIATRLPRLIRTSDELRTAMRLATNGAM